MGSKALFESSSTEKREQFVQGMFNRIARRYDLLNRIISFHLDTFWRKKLVQALDIRDRSLSILDVGTGTGDLALLAAREMSSGGAVFGLDLSFEMIRLAEEKKRRRGLENKIGYLLGTALVSPFKDGTFEAVMTAFVLRNVADLKRFFLEAHRLLKPGGTIASIDMFPPTGTVFAKLYSLYFYRLVPWIGASLAKDHHAYRYLSASVRSFDSPEAVAQMIQEAGFGRVTIRRFLWGAVCLHMAEKP